MNNQLLTAEFRERGYWAQSWFLGNDASHKPNSENIKIFSPQLPGNGVWAQILSRLLAAVFMYRPRLIIGFNPLSNILGALAAPLVGARFVATQRNPSTSQNSILAVIERALGCTPLYYSNIAVSQAAANTYSRYPGLYRRKMRVVHNALPSLAVTSESRETWRARFGFGTDDVVLGYLGRFAPQKNVAFLLELLPRYPKTILALAGEGETEARLRQRAAELGVESRVRFLGALHGQYVSGFYLSIDVFLMPSLYEGFGRALVEAMKMGVPIVVTDLEVTREVAADIVAFAPLEPDQWCAAITSLLQLPPNERVAYARRAEERADSYSTEAMVSGYLAAAGFPKSAIDGA